MALLQSVVSGVLGAWWRLPPGGFGVDTTRSIRVAMRDGVELATDLYRPRGARRSPTILMRSPYGRRHVFGLVARMFAQRGYAVVLQSVRGTFGSQGSFDPFFQERDDGLDAVAWIERQPWFDGKLGLYGTSYLGQVIWAIAAQLGSRVSAITVVQSASDFHAAIWGGGAFRLQDFLQWTQQIATQERGHPIVRLLKKRSAARHLQRHHQELPLRTLDERAIGAPIGFWRTWVEHGVDDPIWRALDDHATLDRVTAPVCLIAGWSDIFLDTQERDFRTLEAAGRTVRWVCGPWTHADLGSQREGMRECLAWFDAHLRGGKPSPPERVRLSINPAGAWSDSRTWPTRPTLRFGLNAEGTLTIDRTIKGSRTFSYDPFDPTPSVSGPTLSTRSGRADMSGFASRQDVLTFESDPLESALEIFGRPQVVLTTSADDADHDLYVCLCDTDARGRAINITDGYVRLSNDHRDRRTSRIACLPTAWRVESGHRLQLLVAGGAFPRFDRNLGGAGAVTITVHCGYDDASSLTLNPDDSALV
ncbi:CocE/NonD family hydrolase [soil metagenome]